MILKGWFAVMKYSIGSKSDFDDIISGIVELKETDKLGKDAYVTFDLYRELEKYYHTDWSSVDSEYVTSIRYNLAECVARSNMNFSPNQFRNMRRATDLPAGELLHRNSLEIVDKLSYEETLRELMSDVSDMCDNIAAKTLPSDEWEQFQNKVCNEMLLEGHDADMEANLSRERIYKKHNVDPSTPDRELPYYVSEELESSGVVLSDDVEF